MASHPLTEWLSEHPTICDILGSPKVTKPRTRKISHVIDLTSIPKSRRFDLVTDLINESSQHFRHKKVRFGWWIIPSSLGIAFYR